MTFAGLIQSGFFISADTALFGGYLQSDALTQELVDMLIDRVLVYPDGKIDICWKIAAFGEVQLQKQVDSP